MIYPTIQAGTDSAEALIQSYQKAADALSEAFERLRDMHPQPEHYIADPRVGQVMELVMREHTIRLEAVLRVRDEMLMLVKHCIEQVSG